MCVCVCVCTHTDLFVYRLGNVSNETCSTRKCSIAAESHIRSHHYISSKIQLFW